MSALAHFDRELIALDHQIVRLGKLFNLDMTKDATVMAVLHGVIRAENYEQEARKAFRLMQGLLELRYHIEEQCVENIGSAHCREILDTTLLK